jgi:hypothetical protein
MQQAANRLRMACERMEGVESMKIWERKIMDIPM